MNIKMADIISPVPDEFQTIFGSATYKNLTELRKEISDSDDLHVYFIIQSAKLNKPEGKVLSELRDDVTVALLRLVNDFSESWDINDNVEAWESILDLVKDARDIGLLDEDTNKKISKSVSIDLFSANPIDGFKARPHLSSCIIKFRLALNRGIVSEEDKRTFNENLEVSLAKCFSPEQLVAKDSKSKESILNIDYLDEVIEGIKSGLISIKLGEVILSKVVDKVFEYSQLNYTESIELFKDLTSSGVKTLEVSTEVKKVFEIKLTEAARLSHSYDDLSDVVSATKLASTYKLVTTEGVGEIRRLISERFHAQYLMPGPGYDLAHAMRAYVAIFDDELFSPEEKTSIQILMVEAVKNIVKRSQI